MAVVPVLVFFGDSNMSGLADLADVSATDFDRWTGTTWSSQAWPTLPAGPSDEWPKDADVPDVKALCVNMPHETATELTVSSVKQKNILVADTALSDSGGHLLVTSTAHGLVDDDIVTFAHSSRTYPVTNLSARTVYYVAKISDDTFKLSTTAVAAPTYVAYAAPSAGTSYRFACTAITVSTSAFAATDQNAWLFVSEDSTGYGQTLRILTDPSGHPTKAYVVDALTYNEGVDAALELIYAVNYAGGAIITMAGDGKVLLLEKSHSINAVTTPSPATGSPADSSQVEIQSGTPGFNAGLVAGQWATVVSGAGQTLARRVLTQDSSTKITVTPALPATVRKGDGIREMLAANTAKSMADLTTSTNFAWRALRFLASQETSHSNPADFCTYTSLPWTCPQIYGTTEPLNSVPETTWAAKSHFSGTLYTVIEGVGGATACSQNVNDELLNLASLYSYGIDIDHNDFRPGSPNGLYTVLTRRLDAAKALITAGGDTMNVVGIFSNVGTNDAYWEDYANQYEYAMGEIIDALRAYVVANSMSALTSGQIPFGLTMVNAPTTVRPYRATVNAAIKALSSKPGVFYVDTTDTDVYELENDNLHLAAEGQIQLGRAFYLGWRERWADYQQGKVDNAAAVDVCNIALAYIGETAQITSLDTTVDTSQQAALCSRFWPVARDSLLNMHRWDFATKRVVADSLGSPTTRDEWDYAYSVPIDCLQVFAVLPPEAGDDYSLAVSRTVFDTWPTPLATPAVYTPQDFVIERGPNGGQILYTNQANAVLRYLARVNSAVVYPPLFKEALAWHLASMLAGPILSGREGAEMAQRCLLMFRQVLGQAASVDANGRSVHPIQNTPWITGR